MSQVTRVESEDGDTRKGRRPGITIHESNPFVKAAAATSKVGTRRLPSRDGQRFMIVSDDGEIVAPAGFHEIVEVDKTAFVKLYAQGVKAFAGLTSAGAKVFEVIYAATSEAIGTDRIHVHFKKIDQNVTRMSPATFKRGMRELLEAGFIAESAVPGEYWLNVSFMFNGNRLAFIKEYRVAKVSGRRAGDQAEREQLEAAGQQRLSD